MRERTASAENRHPPAVISGEEWAPLSLAGILLVGFLSAVIVYFHLNRGWVPILDSANLMFHEAGHPIFGLLGQRMGLYGGTLGQLAFPIATGMTFYRRRESLGLAVAALWFFENWLNIARYMADARSQNLPLLGGGEHDWYLIFSAWNVLGADGGIAGAVRLLSGAGIAVTVYWAWNVWKSGRGNDERV